MVSKRLAVVSALAGALQAQVGWVPVRQFANGWQVTFGN